MKLKPSAQTRNWYIPFSSSPSLFSWLSRWLFFNRVGKRLVVLHQPFSIFLPWWNPWNNCQVSGNPYIKIIISTAHGTLAWSVICRYNNPTIIVNAILSREWYFCVDLFIFANKFKKKFIFIFSITISRGTPSDISRNPRVPRNPGWETLFYTILSRLWCGLFCSLFDDDFSVSRLYSIEDRATSEWLWSIDKDMDQEVRRWPLTAEARVRAQVDPFRICGRQSGTGAGCSPSFSVFLC
jgi:hypothetical protein